MATMYAADGTNTRTYNDVGQLTGITRTGTNVLTIGYSYPSTGNNGRISGMVIGGESVTYAYDVLNQLMTEGSSTRGTTPFEYDQYGNLTRNGGQTIPVNPANNRLLSSAYDANGNYSPSGYAYDIENRLTAAGGADNYGYDAGNKRVWKKAGSVEQISFYGREGRLGIHTLQWSGTTLSFGRAEQNYYFAGRLLRSRTDWSSDGGWVLVDRLGSVVKKDGADRRYTPYGQEYTSSPNNEQKFGTYYRDDQTGLDYADQRYYQFTVGRFSTPDPRYGGDTFSPGSLNLFSYVEGDPVNSVDPDGLMKCGDVPWDIGLTTRQTMTGTSALSLLADIMWHEAGPRYSSDSYDSLRAEQLVIGTAMLNRLAMSVGLVGFDEKGQPHQYQFGTSLSSVILKAGGEGLSWGIFEKGKLSGRALDRLNTALDAEIGTPETAEAIRKVSPECYAVMSAIWGAIDIIYRGKASEVKSDSMTLFWNSSARATTNASSLGLNPELVNFGFTSKVRGNVFFGLCSSTTRYDGRAPEGRESPVPRPGGTAVPRPGGGRPR